MLSLENSRRIPPSGPSKWRSLSALLASLIFAACGGGAATTATSQQPAASCDPGDVATHGDCATVLVGLTDADGDFLNYAVDVTSIELRTANGRIVETLPASTRINFTDYVELSEIISAAVVPPAVYVAGKITLDYGDAEVFVEADGAAKPAVVTDLDGNAVTTIDLDIRLADRDRLALTRGSTAFLQLDFDLAASHTVDVVPTPAVAATETFIVAETLPVDEKTIRVRGPLVSVDEAAGTYTVALRPFHDHSGDFGDVVVQTTASTEFEIDGEGFVGSVGLRALAAAGPGTPTAATGLLDLDARRFTAQVVLGGSSVPGVVRDAVVGNVVARRGNFLTIRGATLLPSSRAAYFHDDVVVEIGPETRVLYASDRRTDVGTGAISIGQRVTVVAARPDSLAADPQAPQMLFDATAGIVTLHVTKLAGIVNAVMPGQADIELHAIDRRRASVFDFSGTGPSPDLDADPANYEIDTGNLTLNAFASGEPIVVRGFPTAFGSAPPDFSGRSVVDFSELRSALGIGWGIGGTTAPFLSTGPDGLLLDNGNADIGERHYIRLGTRLIDLTALDSDTLIVPRSGGRALYYVKSGDSLRLYTAFDDFVADLQTSLNGATALRSMHAHGSYDAAANVFTAYRLGLHLLER